MKLIAEKKITIESEYLKHAELPVDNFKNCYQVEEVVMFQKKKKCVVRSSCMSEYCPRLFLEERDASEFVFHVAFYTKQDAASREIKQKRQTRLHKHNPILPSCIS